MKNKEHHYLIPQNKDVNSVKIRNKIQRLLKKKGYEIFSRGLNMTWYKLSSEETSSLQLSKVWFPVESNPSMKDQSEELINFLS